MQISNKKPNPVDFAVGRNIRFYRIAARLSQGALGDKIGVTFQQVQKYEKGSNRVGASRLNQIATALGIGVVRLFDGVPAGSNGKPGERSATELIAEPHAFRLAHAFAEISKLELRRSIVQLVEQIVVQEKTTR